MSTLSFEYRHSISDILSTSIKRRIFSAATARSSKLFLRGGDTISVAPQIRGVHEVELNELIRQAARDGHGDFLLDIGANIGLISCQCGDAFQMVEMLEPNPLCASILSVNCKIALRDGSWRLHEYGLANEDGTLNLVVPKDNWGGAFLDSQDNALDKETQARKDGLDRFNPDNYLRMSVAVRKSTEALAAIFADRAAEGQRNGVIKIDVEGFEGVVLEALAESLPPDFSVIIVFENWDRAFDFPKLVARFGERAKGMVLEPRRPWPAGASLLRKAAGLMLQSSPHSVLIPQEEARSTIGDLVLQVDTA